MVVLSALPLKPGTLPHNLAALTVITMVIGSALPVALAIEPGQMTLDATSLEPEFHNMKDKHGNPITEFYASKGL